MSDINFDARGLGEKVMSQRVTELEKQVEELKEALIIRVEYSICPECKMILTSVFGHDEDCRFFRIEQEAQP